MAQGIPSREQYRKIKSIERKNRTQKMNEDILAYEAQAAGMPSKEDMERARLIHNAREPHLQERYRKDGSMDWALDILSQSRAANELLRKRGQLPYVRPVKSTPEDVMESGGFKFNWRDVYENVKGEKLRATEADAKKLNEFINSNLYDINDKDVDGKDINLQKIAYDLHMWNPNTSEPWPEFIHSEQGERFQNYLEDVQKAQKDKRLDEIWDGEDDNKLTSVLTDFMLPVSKEYAKKNYEKINVEDKVAMAKDMVGPLAVDGLSNFIMTGLGSGLLKKAPKLSSIYGNVAAPALTETGNVLFNDQSIPEAGFRTAEGTAINLMTPWMLKSGINKVGGGTAERKVQQDWINEAANKARNVRKKMNAGDAYPALRIPEGHKRVDAPQLYTKKKKMPFYRKKENPTIYSSDPARSMELSLPRKGQQSYLDVNYDLPRNQRFITPEEILTYQEGIPLLRGKNPAGGLTNAKSTPNRYDITIKRDQEWLKSPENVAALKSKAAVSRNTHGDNFSGLSDTERRRFEILLNKSKGIDPKYNKESVSNYLMESFKELAGDVGTTYATNMAGRPVFGRRAGPIRILNQVLGDDFDVKFFKKDQSPEEAQLERILKMLEVEHPYIKK